MKKITLLIFMCLLGYMSSWAGDTYTVLYGVPSGSPTSSVANQTDFTGDANEKTSVTFSDANGNTIYNIGGSVLLAPKSGSGWTKYFASAVTEGKVYFHADYTNSTNGTQAFQIVDSEGNEIFGSCQNNTKNNATQIVAYFFSNDADNAATISNYVRQPRSAGYDIDLVIDLDTRKLTYTTHVSSASNKTTTLTNTINIPESINGVLGLKVNKKTYESYIDNVALYSVVSGETKYDCSIVYKLGETIVRTVNGKYAAGETLTADDDFYVEGTRYRTTSTTKTLTVSAENTTLTVNVEEYPIYSYNVKTSLGGVLTSGSDYADASITYYWPNYILQSDVFYVCPAVSNQFKGSFTLDEDNKVVTKTYTDSEIKNVVFYTEAEDITGISVATGSNADIRASMGKGGFASSSTTITTLSAGKYILYASNRCSGEKIGMHEFYAGDVLIFAADGNGYNALRTSEEFTITENTEIKFQGGDNNNFVDFIYIQKTGDVQNVTITEAGWATACVPFKATVSGATAYKVSVADGKLTKTALTVIPAETGVLLKGEAGTVTFTESAEDADDVTDNMMVGTVAAGGANFEEAGYKYYILSNPSNGIGFYWDYTNYNGLEGAKAHCDQYKAILKVAESAGAKSFSLEDEATGIESVQSAELGVQNGMYNLNGVRVNGSYKGIVINNGKKFINK